MGKSSATIAGVAFVAGVGLATAPVILPRNPMHPIFFNALAIGLGVVARKYGRLAIVDHELGEHSRTIDLEYRQRQATLSRFPERAPQLLPQDDLGRALLLLLRNYNIEVDYMGTIVAPSFRRLRIKSRETANVRRIRDRAEDLKAGLGLPNPPMIDTDQDCIVVDVPRPDRQFCRLLDYIEPKFLVDQPVRVAIGVDLNGKVVDLDLSDPNCCHLLIGGTTGGGKTETLKAILQSLMFRYPPEMVRIILVDPKRVTFPQYGNLPWLYADIAKDESVALKFMGALEREMRERYKLMEAHGVDAIEKLNKLLPQPLPRLILAFDEYADFMNDRKLKQQFEQWIKPLASMARAAGIHIILATQRPSIDVITQMIRSNLPCRIALKTATVQDSAIILGGDDITAKYLLGKGDLFLEMGGLKQRLQGFYTDCSIDEVIEVMPDPPGQCLSIEADPNPIRPGKDRVAAIPQAIDEAELLKGYREYRDRGLSPDAFLREVRGVRGGGPYQREKQTLWRLIDEQLSDWLKSIDAESTPDEIVNLIWNLKRGKKNAEDYDRRLGQVTQALGERGGSVRTELEQDVPGEGPQDD
jgi:FtsK/SpoIIIE family